MFLFQPLKHFPSRRNVGFYRIIQIFHERIPQFHFHSPIIMQPSLINQESGLYPQLLRQHLSESKVRLDNVLPVQSTFSIYIGFTEL